MLKADLLEEVQRDINFATQRKEVGHQSYLSCHKYYVPRKVQPFAKSLRPCSSSSCKFPHEQPFTGLPRAGHDDISTRTYSVSGTDTKSIHSIQLIMKAAPIAAFLRAPPVLPHDFCCRVTAVGCPDKSWRSAHRDNKPHSNPRNLKPTASREVNFRILCVTESSVLRPVRISAHFQIPRLSPMQSCQAAESHYPDFDSLGTVWASSLEKELVAYVFPNQDCDPDSPLKYAKG